MVEQNASNIGFLATCFINQKRGGMGGKGKKRGRGEKEEEGGKEKEGGSNSQQISMQL